MTFVVVEEVACNRCNAGRGRWVHPCPRCGCPEYRILDPPAFDAETLRLAAEQEEGE